MKITFSPPYIDDSVVDEVTDSLRSGWITTGPKVKALEEEIAKLSGASNVLCVNSWTSGAIMTLRWLGVGPDDEVIVPAYTYCATALSVLWAGAKLVLVDCNEDFNINVEAIRKAITPKTKAIMPVDIAGWPCDYKSIMKMVEEPEIKAMFTPSSPVQDKLGRILVLSDSAHSIGAYYGDKHTGTESDIVIFSLHAVKNVTTAEGGAICFNMPEPFDNAELYKEMRLRALNCQTKDAFTKSKAGGWRYDIVGQGMKCNMADVNAAIGLAQMREYDKMLAERKRVFMGYINALSKHEWAILPTIKKADRETSYHVFTLRIKGATEDQRDEIINEITKREIAVNVHFIPLPMLSFFHGLGFNIEDYPQSYANYSNEISLPVYPQLTDEMVAEVVDALVDACNKVLGK
ncbi:MAG: DegT/DnrJ/EryC1/StrS family aminotransferase [Prevotellaceae bacterium]|nr:DegT/DnrJ/EryC1/StrS family aminotransferase [Prevotellaceae bacterium]